MKTISYEIENEFPVSVKVEDDAVEETLAVALKLGVSRFQGDTEIRYLPGSIKRVLIKNTRVINLGTEPQMMPSEHRAEPEIEEEATEDMVCPHCEKVAIPTIVGSGPNKGLPKCPLCSRIIREEKEEEKEPVAQ